MNTTLVVICFAALRLTVQQDTKQSVTDAAKAAREKQNSATPKHVLTEDDMPSRQSKDRASQGLDETGARANLEKWTPAILTAGGMTVQISQTRATAKVSIPTVLPAYKNAIFAQNSTGDFPGKKEWEEKLEMAVSQLVDEAGSAAPRLQDLFDANQDTLARHDPAEMKKLRGEWIDALVPFSSWQAKLGQVLQEGQALARNSLTNGQAGKQDRAAKAKQSEMSVGYALITLREKETGFKQRTGHYTCDLTDFNYNLTNPRKPINSEIDWDSKTRTISEAGYRMTTQGCDAHHYQAFATPAAADGSEGRAFCVDDTRGVLISPDGRVSTCLTSGQTWSGQ